MQPSFMNDAFFASLERSALPVEDAESLPPACYTSSEFYEFEKEAAFNHEWLCLGRESWVRQPGDYFTTSIVGEPLIVCRDLGGTLRALSAVCQHRGMLVAEGRGNARGFVCPYHHWTYGLDGCLVNAPAMNRTRGFERAGARLPALAVETWLGFVFVNFDHAAPPLAPRLRAVEEAIARYDMQDGEEVGQPKTFRFPWNWKVMFENNNDGYHANRLHHGPLHDFVPSDRSSFPELPPDTAGYLRRNGTLHPDASFNVTQKAILPVFPRLTADDRQHMLFANVPPTLSLVLTSDMVIYLIVRATGAETHEMDVGELVAAGASAQPGYERGIAMIMDAAGKIMAQDQHVDELVQVGLRSRFAARCRYSWQEGAQRQFNCWLVPRYQDCWRRLGADRAAASSR